jgi:hypothetical protein
VTFFLNGGPWSREERRVGDCGQTEAWRGENMLGDRLQDNISARAETRGFSEQQAGSQDARHLSNSTMHPVGTYPAGLLPPLQDACQPRSRHSLQGAAPRHGEGGQSRRRTAASRHTASCGPRPGPAPADARPAAAAPHNTFPVNNNRPEEMRTSCRQQPAPPPSNAAKMSPHISIGPEPVLAVHAPSPPAAVSHCPAREGSAPH